MSLRFTKGDRLSLQSDFSAVLRQGERRVIPHFILYRLETSRKSTRLGIAVSRQIGGAVQRNRLKRRIREWFRHRKDVMPGNFDMVVRCRAGAAEISYQEVCYELDKALGIKH
jgi:ribonuclease P protein component